jgi:enterochelin esterase-like enzyme
MSFLAAAQTRLTPSGTERAGSLLDMIVSSRLLGGDREIHVYLPASYRTDLHRRYPALYLHDGQNVFSSSGADTTFGWGSWELDRIVDELCRQKKMQEIIMIGVDNSPARPVEYSGKRHVQGGSSVKTAFEKYEEFLVRELKPRMDREYRTLPEGAHTVAMGSSLGGLCSLVLAWDNPDVFGAAASLSGAFVVFRPNFVDDVLKGYQGPPKPFRVYLDSGVVDSEGGDDGRSGTEQVVAELRRIGWAAGDLQWFVDERTLTRLELEKSGLRPEKWEEALKCQHNEFYWKRRAWRALTFLFPL